MPRIEISTTFDWDTFVRRYWNKRPVLYKGTSASPFEPGDVFDAATGAARSYLRSSHAPDSLPHLQFTIDRLQQVFLAPWLPRESDGSLEAYDARLAPRLGDRRYALIVTRLHASGFGLWARERAFFSELWRRVGIPMTGGITTLFHGNYEHSPVGVHLDRFTTFLFALHGRKRMRFWPKKPWKEPVSTILDYEPYLKDSFVAEVEPGDILYWPSSYYHVGESAGRGVATSVNVGIPISEHLSVYDVHDLLRGFGDESASTGPAKGASPLARGVLSEEGILSSELPRALMESVGELRGLSRPREVRRQLRTTWLKRLSAAGFEPVPPPARGGRLKDEDRVRGDPRFPILLEPEGTEHWICSANGHALLGAGRVEAVARMFETLSSGREVPVGELLRSFRSRATGTSGADGTIPATREGMRRVLERLQAFRALDSRRAASRV
ncbi:cupin domain-containing protein [Archangium lipolyticum]|uniref:cupin domain-containing protein n=1 Tax=Archangium lipolyticum TaxID=2970465 RepID=UPI00214A850F|nr:cupin domain-containing protein [Archangium lipolyticum]